MALSNEEFMQNQERRRHERFDDEIMMFWREVSPEDVPEDETLDKEPVADFPLSSQMKLLSMESAELLKRISRANPLLAEYLTVLERKVDILASTVLGQDNFIHSHSTRHVNISASGLAFLTDREYPLGTILEMKMVFSPTLTGIIAYGRVIYCISYEDDRPLSHRIGVGFVRLDDYDREKLAGHLNGRHSHRLGNHGEAFGIR